MRFVKYFSVLIISIWAISAWADDLSFEINDKGLKIRTHSHKEFYRWANYPGYIPGNAAIGGQEFGRALYICQASYQGGLHPGKVVDGRCNITYEGEEIPLPFFNILLGTGFHWEQPFSARSAVVGGHENGHALYICQARLGRGMHPGKLVDGYCNIGFGGQEIRKSNFRVLTQGSGYHPDRLPIVVDGDSEENEDLGPMPVVN